MYAAGLDNHLLATIVGRTVPRNTFDGPARRYVLVRILSPSENSLRRVLRTRLGFPSMGVNRVSTTMINITGRPPSRKILTRTAV